MNIALVPYWRNAYKWLSVQAAALLALLLALQPILDALDKAPHLEALTHTQGYHIFTALIAALIPFLRILHQPVIEPETSVPAVPFAPTSVALPPETPMNQNFTAALNMLPQLITQAEMVFTAPGSGAEKAAAVLTAVAPLVPEDKKPQVSQWMNLLVSLYSLHGLFSKPTPMPTPIAMTGSIPAAFGPKP